MHPPEPSGIDDSGETAVSSLSPTRPRLGADTAKRGTTLTDKSRPDPSTPASGEADHDDRPSPRLALERFGAAVRLCLAEKGLAYEGHVVDMAAMEHHSPEYLKINPPRRDPDIDP